MTYFRIPLPILKYSFLQGRSKKSLLLPRISIFGKMKQFFYFTFKDQVAIRILTCTLNWQSKKFLFCKKISNFLYQKFCISFVKLKIFSKVMNNVSFPQISQFLLERNSDVIQLRVGSQVNCFKAPFNPMNPSIQYEVYVYWVTCMP